MANMIVKWTEHPVYGNDDINLMKIKMISMRSAEVHVLQCPVLIRSVLCRPALKQNRTEHAETV